MFGMATLFDANHRNHLFDLIVTCGTRSFRHHELDLEKRDVTLFRLAILHRYLFMHDYYETRCIIDFQRVHNF